MEYTVEVTTSPVTNDNWTTHLRAIDSVPGAFLIQDASEPMISFPVTANDAMEAAHFVGGVASLIDLDIIKGSIYPAPTDEITLFDDDDDEAPQTDVVTEVNEWMRETPNIRERHSRHSQEMACN